MAQPYFDRFLAVTPMALALWRAQEAEALSNHQIKSPSLDLGCGFSEFMGVFAPGKINMGIDICERDLKISQKRRVYQQTRLADARHLPFANESYQTILSISVLEHIPHVRKVFKEAYRVLKPGGLFLFSVPTELFNQNLYASNLLNRLKLPQLAQAYSNAINNSFKHEPLQSKQYWLNRATSAGFSVISCTSTLSSHQLHVFECGLPTSTLSQIGRSLVGKRFVINTPWRLRFWHSAINSYLKSHSHSIPDINIFVVCQK